LSDANYFERPDSEPIFRIKPMPTIPIVAKPRINSVSMINQNNYRISKAVIKCSSAYVTNLNL